MKRANKAGVVRFSFEGDPQTIRFNTLTLNLTTALAGLLAGRTQWTPSHIGFVFGKDAAPASLVYPISSTQTKSSIQTELSSVTDPDVAISPITISPAIATQDPDETGVVNNSVTFGATTGAPGSVMWLGNRTAIEAADYLYDIILFAKTGDTTFVPLARATLNAEPDRTGAYPQMTTGRNFVAFWSIDLF